MVGLLPRRANKYALIQKWIQPEKKFNALSTSLFVTRNDSHEIVRVTRPATGRALFRLSFPRCEGRGGFMGRDSKSVSAVTIADRPRLSLHGVAGRLLRHDLT
jgi:hypothetical protein